MMTISNSIKKSNPLLGVAIVLFAALCGTVTEADDVTDDGAVMRIDGSTGKGIGWDESDWYVQVDGVMGGKSSGYMEFLTDESTETTMMEFTGDINLDGGGFSSVRRRIDLDLSDYAGVVVTLEAKGFEASTAPMGIHLEFGDTASYYDYSSAIAIPLAAASEEEGSAPVLSSVFLPVDSFDRGTWIGRQCRDNCRLDIARITGMSVYVLFQEGGFDVKLKSIVAVKDERSFPSPILGDEELASPQSIMDLLQATISSGGGLYDKSYRELCIALHWSALNTIIASNAGAAVQSVKVVACSGLNEMMNTESKADKAWILRYTMEAIIADLEGIQRPDDVANQSYLPTAEEAPAMDLICVGKTSPSNGIMYDSTNENVYEVSDEVFFDDEFSALDGGNSSSIPSVAADNGSFTTLVAALGAADLVDALSAEGPFTVFAPTDDAFATLPAFLVPCLLLPGNKDTLTSILTYHVASGSVMSTDLFDDMEVPTLQGENVTIDITDGAVKVNTATVVIADVAADNGIIHAIDGVLVPPSIDVAAFLETCPEVDDEDSIPEAISKAAMVEDDGMAATTGTSNSGGGTSSSNANKISSSRSAGSGTFSSTFNIVWVLVAATAFVISASACM